MEKNDVIQLNKIDTLLARGFSVIVNRLETRLRCLADICAEIEDWLHEASYTAVIVTSGADGAFSRHYDPEDILVAQIEGSKRWQIFEPAVVYPVKGATPNDLAPEGDPVFDEVLHEGDLLLVPTGYWHHCQTERGVSVHLGFDMLPPTTYT